MSSRVLTFHFSLRDSDGRLLETTRGGDPASCIEGAGQIIDGLEAALRGLKPGESRKVVIAPEQAYGPRDDSLIQWVPREHLPIDEPTKGAQFQAGPDRHAPIVTVLEVEPGRILLDANHPLAGQRLSFEVELVAARPATAAELTAAQAGE